MSLNSLGDAFDSDVSLNHSQTCQCDRCTKGMREPLSHHQERAAWEREAERMINPGEVSDKTPEESVFDSSEAMLDRVVENAVVRSAT